MSGRAVALDGRAPDVAGQASNAATPICTRPGFKPEPGRLTLWDGQASCETVEAKRRRHASALRLCNVCPAIEQCRRWLGEADKRGVLVDGVVGGTVRAWRRNY
ncbi:hypothetical protein [Rhodococcoides fascians]|uniref:hypothetical protein n=1 Tax=Rhodococcoides fascians TaxID=1828 RepID=UPI0012D2B55F|nr:hypothetical protein [Rhodococcus fascians]